VCHGGDEESGDSIADLKDLAFFPNGKVADPNGKAADRSKGKESPLRRSIVDLTVKGKRIVGWSSLGDPRLTCPYVSGTRKSE